MGIRKGTLSFSRYRLIGAPARSFPRISSTNGSGKTPFRPSGAPRTKRRRAGRAWRIPWIRTSRTPPMPRDATCSFPSASTGSRSRRPCSGSGSWRPRGANSRETGQKKLYREQREAIREATRLELLGQTLPVPSFFEICWSVPDNTLYLLFALRQGVRRTPGALPGLLSAHSLPLYPLGFTVADRIHPDAGTQERRRKPRSRPHFRRVSIL